MMKLGRLFRHLFTSDWLRHRAFPAAALQHIEQEIKTGEAAHAGELRFAVEASLSGAQVYDDQPTRERAIDVFSDLRMWDTDDRNGVLIYLLLADHSVEIVADRGIHARVGSAAWEGICQAMEADFKAGRFEDGAIKGVRSVNALLTSHFPDLELRRNELADHVVVL